MPPIDRAATWIGAVRRLLSLSLRRVFRAGAVAALGILVVEIFLHVALGALELRNGYR